MQRNLSRDWPQRLHSTLLLVFVAILSIAFAFHRSFAPAQAQDSPQAFPNVPRIHLPYIPSPDAQNPVRFAETAIFWLGAVNSEDNYSDVRVGYNDDLLYIYIATFDRQMWYDTNPVDPNALAEWDAVTLYLTTGTDATRHRLTVQTRHWQDGAAYQAAWQDDGSGWAPGNLAFTGQSGWRGDLPNDNSADERGWAITVQMPFSGLGLAAPPAAGTAWRLGLTVHDRDSADGPARTPQTWPSALSAEDVSTWGEFVFGQADYTPLPAREPQSVMIYDKAQEGLHVPDAAVGGGAICGEGLDFWDEWGDANYAGRGDFNIQNQSDVADWPCFSKYYVTFPLNALPTGQGIVSATLTLHLFGTAGGGDWGGPAPSLIQAGVADADWDETQITWNNAPYLLENISSTWVQPVADFPGWPGIPYDWDVSRAVADAYARGIPLRLVLYSADSDYHSGKYFVSSDTGDWNVAGRPSLTVTFGQADATPLPTATPQATLTPTPPQQGYLRYLPNLTKAQ